MLKIIELKAFLDETKEAIPEITKVALLSNERRYAKLTKELSEDDIVLIAILPGAKSKFDNEDKKVYKNNLAFLVVTRFDPRKDEKNYLNSFIITQSVMDKVENRLRNIKSNIVEQCVFSDLDFGSLSIMPVENYHQSNGWDLSISVETIR